MSHTKQFKIIVNGTEETVSTETMSFDEVVNLAFPGHPADPNIVFSVTYEKAASKPHEGTLGPGGSVEIKNHTTFDVTQTNRS